MTKRSLTCLARWVHLLGEFTCEMDFLLQNAFLYALLDGGDNEVTLDGFNAIGR